MADRHGKLKVYRIVAPGSALMFVVLTHLPPVHAAVAIALFGVMMAFNVGRMIPAMAMVTSSVEPRRRGGFLSANSSLQRSMRRLMMFGLARWTDGFEVLTMVPALSERRLARMSPGLVRAHDRMLRVAEGQAA